MDIQKINRHTASFNEITHFVKSDDGKEQIEVWFARELQSVLGYARWENFLLAVNRAMESCKSQKVNSDDHFRELTKMVGLGDLALMYVNETDARIISIREDIDGKLFGVLWNPEEKIEISEEQIAALHRVVQIILP